MAKKTPETVIRFRVWAEIEKGQLGDVVAAFTQLGLQNIGHEMITDVLNFKKRSMHEITGNDFLRAFIKDNATFTRTDVTKAFEADGRTKHSSDRSIQNLRELGEIRQLATGNYQRADVKAIAGPKRVVKAAKPAKSKKTGEPLKRKPNAIYRHEVPNLTFLLKKIASRKKFTIKEMEAAFKADGRNERSVSPIITLLAQKHKVRRLSQGEYAIVKRKLTPRAATLNGATPHPQAEVTANG